MPQYHVPVNAGEIIDAIMPLIEWCGADDPELIPDKIKVRVDTEVEIESAEFDLSLELDLLPYKWCGMSPFEYVAFIYQDTELALGFVSREDIGLRPPVKLITNDSRFERWPKDCELPVTAKKFFIPQDLAFVLDGWADRERTPIGLDSTYLMLVSGWLSDLKRKCAVVNSSRGTITDAGLDNLGARLESRSGFPPSETSWLLAEGDRTLRRGVEKYTFTPQQSLILRYFYEVYLKSDEFMPEQVALDAAKLTTSTFDSIFKSRRDAFKRVFEQHSTERDLWRLRRD